MRSFVFSVFTIFYWFQFVCRHPVSDISKTVSNPGNCSGESHAIMTTKGGVQLSITSGPSMRDIATDPTQTPGEHQI